MFAKRVSSPWTVCIVLLLATLLNYMDRQALAVTLPTLKAELQLHEQRIGMIEGCFGFSFAFGCILFGWLGDRWGPRYLYPIVLVGWSLAGIATSFAGSPSITEWFATGGDASSGVYHWLLLCRIALGVCEAGHWPCALLTVRSLLAPRERTLGNGILQSGASIGATIVPIYIQAAESAGKSWEFSFRSIGLAGLLWVPLWFYVTQGHRLSGVLADVPGDRQSSTPNTPHASARPILTADELDRHLLRRLVVLAVVIGTLTISWQFLRAWLALFLQDNQGYSKLATRGLMSGYFIAADVGCILSGLLVSRLALRGWQTIRARNAGYAVFTLLTACGALVPFVGNGSLMVGCLYLAGAGILGLHPYYYSMSQELSAHRMGLYSGFLGAFGWTVSSVSQILLGRQIEATRSYATGLLLVGMAPVLGLLAILIFWPRPRQESQARRTDVSAD